MKHKDILRLVYPPFILYPKETIFSRSYGGGWKGGRLEGWKILVHFAVGWALPTIASRVYLDCFCMGIGAQNHDNFI